MKNFIFILFILIFIACNTNAQKKTNKTTIAKNIDATTFEQLIAKDSNTQLIDVRTAEEYNTGHIHNAQNINYNNPNFETEISKLDKDKPVFIYCLSGGRSGNALKTLQSKGFKEIYNLEGGIISWKANDKKIEVLVNNSLPHDLINMESYNHLLTKNTLVLVDFYATWCAPCKILSPIVESLEKEMNNSFKLEKLNYDNCNTLIKPLQISSIPLLILYKNGKEVWRKKGITSKEELKSIILEYK